MQKTKLGISVGLLGAAAFLMAYFGGYTPVLLLTGYVLLFEENAWLKRSCVKAIALMVSYACLLAIIGFIPDILGCISSLMSVFDGYFDYAKLSAVLNVITGVLDIIRTALFLLLGMKALNQGTIRIPYVDGLLDKYI